MNGKRTMHGIRKGSFVATLLTLGCLTLGAQQHTIKFATVAPEGTSWMTVMREYEASIRKETGGRVAFRIYSGAVQGDERVVLRKIRAGQLHAGGFTGVAIGEIASKVRLLDSPFLFRSYEEVDYVYEKFDEEFRQAFLDGGYVLLGWAEVGFVYVFTNSPVARPEDLKSLKMWAWEGDPIAEALFREFGIHPIPLAMPDVMTSLQTRLIDAFYAPPYAALMLQWYTRAKFLVDVRLSDAAGAVLIARRVFEELPKDVQFILLEQGKKHFRRLTQISREQNADAIHEMTKRGLTLIKPNQEDYRYYIDVSSTVRRNLAGKVYPEDFLRRVESALEEFRRNNRKPSP
ncbi:MAG: TRAP transporter substrate-binding protein DctP [Ignavibacteriales bacterium]|nr:TRAP transporter substrate-binding protein DctP [Ignavibacteriales bacterium]